MVRRRRPDRREIRPDPKYNDSDLARFINKIMMKGKQTVAQRIVYDAMDIAERETNKPGLEIFQQAIRNATPTVEIKSRRIGGATYQVPTEVRPERQLALAMRWIVSSARARTGRSMAQCLSEEFMEASRGQGASIRRKEELYRMAEANRAFASYKW